MVAVVALAVRLLLIEKRDPAKKETEEEGL